MIVVGAGPVGLLVALRLGQSSINTLVLEQHTELLFSTRGCAYQPVVRSMSSTWALRSR